MWIKWLITELLHKLKSPVILMEDNQYTPISCILLCSYVTFSTLHIGEESE